MSQKIYLEQNVFDAALDRIRWLFDEFEHIVVDTSGGKDSTVILNLCLIVAEEKNRLPLRVMFLDQEAEWEATITYIRSLQDDPRIQLDWLQVPFKLFNASSQRTPWLQCWEEGGDWIRPKEETSIHANTYGTDRFVDLLDRYLDHTFPPPAIHIAGVRAQESPGRARGLTQAETYKGVCWGSKTNKKAGYYTFYPIYDWEISDVWAAIHRNAWPYNTLYDVMYQYGVSIVKMRVSNLNHETALTSLYFLQEVEPDTWEKVTARLFGINTVGQLKDQFFCPKDLPFMFASWQEYRDHLLDTLITDAAIQAKFRIQFDRAMKRFLPEVHGRLIKTQIAMILVNDYHRTKMGSFTAAYLNQTVNRGIKSGRTRTAATR